MTEPLRPRFVLGMAMALVIAAPVLLGCSGQSRAPDQQPAATSDLGVDAGELTPVIDNPYVPFSSLRRAVYEGKEFDPETRDSTQVRVEATVRDSAETVAGVKATVVEVSDFDDGELVEKTRDYYAQDRSGVVYYIGEMVDDYEGEKIVGHGGQWMAGEKGSRAGVFMPAAPKVGDVFEQERAPGVAEDQSKVIAIGLSLTVPAGTFQDCIETEDFDPISKHTQRKVYCRGVGLVREVFGQGGSIELVKLETR